MEAALIPTNDLENSGTHTTLHWDIDRGVALFLLSDAWGGTNT
jgi:hypothetical protein